MFLPAGITNHEAAEYGYKRGVESALASMAAHDFESPYIRPVLEEIRKALQEIRKALLTKKVTKWVNVYADEGGLESGGNLYDSKIAAEMGVGRAVYTSKHAGTYPIEIEVPL